MKSADVGASSDSDGIRLFPARRQIHIPFNIIGYVIHVREPILSIIVRQSECCSRFG